MTSRTRGSNRPQTNDRSRNQSVATRNAGYLSKFIRSGRNNNIDIKNIKRFYFVLGDESLSYYTEKNDSNKKGEISLPCEAVPTNEIGKKHTFKLIPMRSDNEYEFKSRTEDAEILIADSSNIMNDWIAKINEHSQRLMEKQIFRDDLSDTSDKLSYIQQQVQSQLRDSLYENKFGLDNAFSRWRTHLSIRGLTAKDRQEQFYESFIVGTSEDSNKSFERCTAMAVHNKENLVITGGKPHARKDERSGGALRLYQLQVTQTAAWENNEAIPSPNAHAMQQQMAGSNDDMEEEHDLTVVKTWQTSDGIVDLDWRQNLLLVSTTEGRVLCYKMDVQQRKVSSDPTIFNHSNEKSIITAPGSWMQSPRVNSVKLARIPNPDCFLSVKNQWFYLWSLDSPDEPVFSEKASQQPLYALEWHPKKPHIFMVGGVSRNLKMVDTRQVTRNPSKAVPLVFAKAHDNVIRDIAWNPLVEYWVASCGDDACVKIWDTRFPHGPVRVLDGHTNTVNRVRWSKSHCEVLVSGSVDHTVRLWNLRVGPHYLLHSQPFLGSVVGCGFSGTRPLQYFATSSEGELRSIEMTDQFVQDFVPHNFPPHETKKRDVSLSIYMRRLGYTYQKIPELAEECWNQQKYDKAQELLDLVSTVGFEHSVSNRHTDFDTMLEKCSSFYHPNCVKLSEASKRDEQRCEIQKIRLYLRKVLMKKDWKKILYMEAKIFDHLMDSFDCFSSDLLRDIVLLFKQNDYLQALHWGMKLSQFFAKWEKYDQFLPIANLLLYPTIYHPTSRNSAVSEGDMRKAQRILEKKMLPQFVDDELKLLYSLHKALRKPDASQQIIAKVERKIYQSKESQTSDSSGSNTPSMSTMDSTQSSPLSASTHETLNVITQSAYRVYFNALLDMGDCTDFFIHSSKLVSKIKGFEFADTISAMMDAHGYQQMRIFLDENLNGTYKKPLKKKQDSKVAAADSKDADLTSLKGYCNGILSVIKLCTNCPDMPLSLQKLLPPYMTQFQSELKHIFTKMKNNGRGSTVRKYAFKVNAAVTEMHETNILQSAFFNTEIFDFLKFLSGYCVDDQ